MGGFGEVGAWLENYDSDMTFFRRSKADLVLALDDHPGSGFNLLAVDPGATGGLNVHYFPDPHAPYDTAADQKVSAGHLSFIGQSPDLGSFATADQVVFDFGSDQLGHSTVDPEGEDGVTIRCKEAFKDLSKHFDFYSF